MKKQVSKEITACDHCGQEIVSANHRFVDTSVSPEYAFDLHADCMKQIIVSALRARIGYASTEEVVGVTCRGAYALGTACGHCSRCDKDPMNPKNNITKS